jgi:hypothetical protein
MRQLPTLKPMKIGNHEFMINPTLGYYPYFTVELLKRIKQKKANNVCTTGEAGSGKSYNASDICRNLSRRFDVSDIVFRYPEFLRCVMTSKRNIPIEFDEPSYAMSKKDWYKELNKALVKTIESFRFKGKPLFIPIINKALLESDIRKYLLQFHVYVMDRGFARAYRLYADQFSSKVFKYEICELHYGLYDFNLCDKDSCLTCKKLNPSKKSVRCLIFRARYERKKIGTQEERYKVALEEAEDMEYSRLSLDEIQSKALLFFDKFYNPDKDDIDAELMAIVLKREKIARLGHNKLQRLKKQIQYDHPELFNADKISNRKALET